MSKLELQLILQEKTATPTEFIQIANLKRQIHIMNFFFPNGKGYEAWKAKHSK